MSEKGGDDISTVGRGINTLIKCSIKLQDSELTEYLQTHPSVVKVHNSCRRSYTSKRKIEQLSATWSFVNDSSAQHKCLRSASETSVLHHV